MFIKLMIICKLPMNASSRKPLWGGRLRKTLTSVLVWGLFATQSFGDIEQLVGLIQRDAAKDLRAYLKADPGAADRPMSANGWRPLHYSAYLDRPACTAILLNDGVEMEAATPLGHTALHMAAGRNAIRTAEVLYKRKANLDARDANGN